MGQMEFHSLTPRQDVAGSEDEDEDESKMEKSRKETV